MKIAGMKCPHCNASLGDIEDGRVNIFCTYCGSSLFLDIENDEVKNIVEIKRAEADLTNAKANYAGQHAKQVEAEVERQKYKDSLKQNTGQKASGYLLILVGITITLVCLILTVAVFGLYKEADESIKGMYYFAMYFLVFIGGLGGLCIVGKGWALSHIPVGANRIRIEGEIEELKSKLRELDDESEECMKIINESGSALWGGKAAARKMSKERLAQIKQEKTAIDSRIGGLEKKLSGDY